MSYLCPYSKCDLIPEVLSVHSDSGIIVFKCNQGHLCEIDILEYFKILEEKRNIIPKFNIKENNFDIKESDILSYSNKNILEKEKEIKDIIRFNELMLSVQDFAPKNYIYNENLINIEASIKEENNLSTELDNIIKLEIEDKKNEEKEALRILKEKYYIDLEKYLEQEKLFLKLKGPKQETNYIKCLKDDGFKLISKLRFKNLIEINFANNNIANISPLNNMLLPHLEIINFSNNLIVDITPIANLQSHNLLEIYLHNNLIQDLEPFLYSNFPKLEIFGVEDNKEAFHKPSFEYVLNKYENIILYESKNWNDFNKEYGFDCYDYQKLFKIDLGSRKQEKILNDLYPLIISPNNIKYLILVDNNLKDVSLLNRMPLYHLELLDLSLNLISSIKFLKKMSKKCKYLKTLYLNDNKINDISPLTQTGIDENKGSIKLIFELNTLSLKKNNLDLKDRTTKDILEMLLNTYGLNIDYEKKDLYEDDKENGERNSNYELFEEDDSAIITESSAYLD